MELNNLKEDMLMGDTNEATVPAPLLASAPVLDISFHPTLPIIAAGLITGEVEVFERKSLDEMVKIPLMNDFSSWIFKGQYSENEVVMNYHHQNMLMHPSGGVSSMEFTDDGAYLVTASSDRTISVMDCVSLRLVIHIPSDEVKARAIAKKKLNSMNKKNDPSAKTVAKKLPKNGKGDYNVPVNPHKFGISALNVCDENLIATGDDDGLIAIWDMRERKPAHTYHEHGDYVSQLCYFTDVQELVSSSGDTCLGVYDMRAGKIRDFSVKRKDELNCFAFINNSGISNSVFIPSIICGTPQGGLPIWKYGSWARPYDVLERHPAECESIVSFHGESTAFNHNLILTGACDGLVRVLQMYPVRRNLCQLSARDYTYSHSASVGENKSSSGGSQHQGNYVARRTRGQEAITRMRVSHDANLLAVSGSDNIIDFVDIAFLNNEEELDRLRGKAEQRHLRTIRELDRERDEAAERESRLMEGGSSDSGKAKDTDDEYNSSDDNDDSSRSSSSGAEDTEAKLARRAALREKLLKLGAVQKRRRSDSSDSDDSDSEEDYKKDRMTKSTTAANRKESKQESGKNVTPAVTAGVHKSKKKAEKSDISASKDARTKSGNETASKKKTSKKAGKEDAEMTSAVGQSATECPGDSMEVYRTERQKNRERAAAARWLKEERRKKINFTFEKRRRRVAGFFGDMVSKDDD